MSAARVVASGAVELTTFASISRFKPDDPTQHTLHDIEFALDIGRDGKVVDAKVVSSTAPSALSRPAPAADKNGPLASLASRTGVSGSTSGP